MASSINTPFLLHILIELPASLNFFIRPSTTLVTTQPYAHAVIRQYALLLMASNIIASIFLFKPQDAITYKVAGALALYHFGPLVRAGSRICGREESGQGELGGPWLHLVVHIICAGALMIEAIKLLKH